MRKALLLTLAISLALVGGAMADGNRPSVGVIPDVIVSDQNAPDQTADNYFVYYSGLDLDSYIIDEDAAGQPINTDVDAAFSVEDGDRNLSLNAISRAREDVGLAEWRDTGVIPAHKNIMATSTVLDVRAVSELWAADGPPVPLFADPLDPPSNLGPYWGFDVTRNTLGQLTSPLTEAAALGTAALVDLLLADDDGNTVTSQFLVKLSDMASTRTPEQRVFWPKGFEAIAEGWDYFGLVGSHFGLNFVPPGSFPRSSDLLSLNSRVDVYHPPTTIPPPDGTPAYFDYYECFGFWKTDVSFISVSNPTGAWGNVDTLVRARWTLDTGNSVANSGGFPSIRSRIRPGGEGTDMNDDWVIEGPVDPTFLPYRGLDTEMRMDPVYSLAGDLLANENLRRMMDANQIELRHYHDPGTFDEQMASTYGLQFAIDLIDMRRSTSAALTIDRLVVDLIDRPSGLDLTTMFSETGAGMAGNTNWIPITTGPGGVPLIVDRTKTFRGSFSLTNTGAGLQATGSTFDENVWALWVNIASGVDIIDGELMRLRMKLHDDTVTTPIPRSTMRMRLYGSDNEVSITLNVPTWIDFLTTDTFGAPDATGAYYDIFMEAPILSPVYGNGQWGMAFDFINTYTGDNIYLNPPGQPQIRYQANWRISEVQLDQVVSPY